MPNQLINIKLEIFEDIKTWEDKDISKYVFSPFRFIIGLFRGSKVESPLTD